MGIKCEGMTGIGKTILVKDLNDVDQWVDENKLMLNAKKTQLLLLGRKGRAQELEDVSVTLNGEQLPRSRMVKCLGASIDDGLMWKEHVDSLRKKCYCGLAKLRRLRDVLPPETKKVYNALVLPHLDYCSVVWQECTKELQQKEERIQNYGMHLILSKPPRTASSGLRETLKWTPLTERRRLLKMALDLVHRCVNRQSPEY